MSRQTVAATAALLAWTARRATVSELHAWRKNPGEIAGRPISASLLRHADEQTLAGLWALQETLADSGTPRDLADWGVIAATSLFGRAAQAQATTRFLAEGAWGISPHLVPHHSLHAPSGTYSLALGLHGPNFGVGGGPDYLGEAFASLAGLMANGTTPGMLLTITQFRPEFVPTPQCVAPGAEATVEALALVLRASYVPGSTLLTWMHTPAFSQSASLADVVDFLANNGRSGPCALPGGIRIDMLSSRRIAA